MIKAIILDCFGVLYQTPEFGTKRQWGKEVMGLARNQELIDHFQTLRADHKLAVLSNCAAGVMDTFFSRRERTQWFDEFVVSSEVGLAKPQPEIFYLTCQKLGVKPEECAFVDDIPTFTEAAAGMGIKSILYQNNQQVFEAVDRLKS